MRYIWAMKVHAWIGVVVWGCVVGLAPAQDGDPRPGAIAPNATPLVAPALTRDAAAKASAAAWSEYAQREQPKCEAELANHLVQIGDAKMPIWSKSYGTAPATGAALFISLHGGGAAPTAVNNQQWENQKLLYEPAEGLYVAPRAPTDSWNMWHQAPLDALLARLIQDLVLCRGVDSNRVYIMGYSAGGDGVYQLAPRMADRWAAVAMMAGHPNDARPDNLSNIGFALHMGANDGAFNRNKVAGEWQVQLAALAAKNEGRYLHIVKLHEGLGHWMNRKDAVAVPWMAAFRRDPRPREVVWLQGNVLHQRFYWLATTQPMIGARCVVRRDGQSFHIEDHTGMKDLLVRLDDSMCDLDQPVSVSVDGKVVFSGIVPRQLEVIRKTIDERGDPHGIFSAEIRVPLPLPPAPQPR